MSVDRKKIIIFLTILIWIGFFIVSVLIYYVNHYLPKGPIYPTGDIVCEYDNRGRCGESYEEDVRGLDVPEWAKFFKKSEGGLLWMALLFWGIVLPVFKEKQEKE